MIYTRQVTISAGATVEVFGALSLSPSYCQVTVQVATGTGNHSVYLVENSGGTNPGPKLPSSYPPAGFLQVITNKDPVYIKNYDSEQAVVGIALTEAR